MTLFRVTNQQLKTCFMKHIKRDDLYQAMRCRCTLMKDQWHDSGEGLSSRDACWASLIWPDIRSSHTSIKKQWHLHPEDIPLNLKKASLSLGSWADGEYQTLILEDQALTIYVCDRNGTRGHVVIYGHRTSSKQCHKGGITTITTWTTHKHFPLTMV